MTKQIDMTAGRPQELRGFLELTERVGRDPLFTQASTGNSSVKIDGTLWIKTSGKWMADALRDDILAPLDLNAIRAECLQRNIDPTERFPGASLETAMHAVLPHRVVLHVHAVNAIAWAVRRDGPAHLESRLRGLRWRWVPYTPSGLALGRAIQRAADSLPGADVFVLANHGLVLGGSSSSAVAELLSDVNGRLAVLPRVPPQPDYPSLSEICRDSQWVIPEDDSLHALSTDPSVQAILAEGLLYPCQAIFSGFGATEFFRAVRCPAPGERWPGRYDSRPFLIAEDRGVVLNRSARPTDLAMIRGLAEVVRRLDADAPIRYLTDSEIAGISGEVAWRYRELAESGQSPRRR